MKNKTIYFRTPKNKDNPYFTFDIELLSLPNDEFTIMINILSNSDNWVINITEIQDRLQRKGMGVYRFKKAIKSLQKKGYLVKERHKISYLWKIYENSFINNSLHSKNNRDFKRLKIEPCKEVPYEEMTERQKLIWKYNNEDKTKSLHS